MADYLTMNPEEAQKSGVVFDQDQAPPPSQGSQPDQSYDTMTPEQAQSAGVVFDDEPAPKPGGMLTGAVAGLKQGLQSAGRGVALATGDRPAADSTPVQAAPNLTFPGNLTYGLMKSFPMLFGGILGGVIGSATGTPIGTLVGGGLGAGFGQGISSLADAYAEKINQNPDMDREEAFDHALGDAAIQGGGAGLGWAAFPAGANMAKTFIRPALDHILIQAGIVQPAIAAGTQAAENVYEGRDPGEGVASAAGQGALGTGVLMAGHAAVKSAIGHAFPPGRPDQAAATPDKTDATGAGASNPVPIAAGDHALEQPPPKGKDPSSPGNTNSESRVYPKTPPAAEGSGAKVEKIEDGVSEEMRRVLTTATQNSARDKTSPVVPQKTIPPLDAEAQAAASQVQQPPAPPPGRNEPTGITEAVAQRSQQPPDPNDQFPDVKVEWHPGVGLAGGSSNDGRTAYLNSNMPRTLQQKSGVTINVGNAIKAHEMGERKLMDDPAVQKRFTVKGKINWKKVYDYAHEKGGNPTEKAYVEASGGNYEEYDAQLKQEIRGAEAQDPKKNPPPADLYAKPYSKRWQEAMAQEGDPSAGDKPVTATVTPESAVAGVQAASGGRGETTVTINSKTAKGGKRTKAGPQPPAAEKPWEDSPISGLMPHLPVRPEVEGRYFRRFGGRLQEQVDQQTPVAKAPPKAQKAVARSKAAEGVNKAALRIEGKVYEGTNHGEAFTKAAEVHPDLMETPAKRQVEEGFTTSKGRFVDRHEANQLEGGTVKEPLVAETLKAKQQKVVTDAVNALRAAGKEDLAKKLEDKPDPQQARKALSLLNAKTPERAARVARKTYGGETGRLETPREATEANPRPKTKFGATQGSEAEARRKDHAVNAAKEAVADERFLPKENETKGQLLDRLKQLVDSSLIRDAKTGKVITDPTSYKPPEDPAELKLLREAKKLIAMKRLSADRVRKFQELEHDVRSGSYNPETERVVGKGEALRPVEMPEVTDTAANPEEALIAKEEAQEVPGLDAESARAAEQVAAQPGPKPDWKKATEQQQLSQGEKIRLQRKARLGTLTPEERTQFDALTAKKGDVSRETPKSSDDLEKQADSILSRFAGDESGAGYIGMQRPPSVPKDVWDRARAAEEHAAGLLYGEKLTAKEAGERMGVSDTRVRQLAARWLRNIQKFAGDESGSFNLNKVKNYFKSSGSYIAKATKTHIEEYARSLSNQLHGIRQDAESHKNALLAWIKSLPDELKQKGNLERLYLARENNSISKLEPRLQELYNRHIKPVLDQNDQLIKNIRDINPDMVGPEVANHISRLLKSHDFGAEHDLLKDHSDPIQAQRGLSVTASTLKSRKFVALERTTDGKRLVISLNDKGYTIWDNGKQTKVHAPNFEFKVGDGWNDPKTKTSYTMREAVTPEIEANARGPDGKRVRYYKNAALSAAVANLYLANVARHMQYIEGLKNDPTFLRNATTKFAGRAEEKGWSKTIFPQLNKYYMEDRLREVFDDAAHSGFGANSDALKLMQDLSNKVTKLMFWLPMAHIANVGVHWFQQRGWDWINPVGYRNLAVTTARAIHGVLTQGADADRFRAAGAGTIYGGLSTQGWFGNNFMQQMGKAAGEVIERAPSKWDPIARTLGVGPSDLARAIYQSSSKIMWAANDVFLHQAYLEQEMKGLSTKEAIAKVERTIPNYRIPTRVMMDNQFGRIMSQLMQDPSLMAFGRYHYGVFNSYAHLVKDLIGPDNPKRMEAIGHLMALGIFAFAVKPVLDKMAQYVTGNKEAEVHPRGPLAIPTHIIKAMHDKGDVFQAARSTFTVPPALSTVAEGLRNQDWAGRPIVPQKDQSDALKGDPKAMGRFALEGAQHVAKGLVAPYNTLMTGLAKGESPLGSIRDQALDIRNPSPGSIKHEAMGPKKAAQELKTSIKRGTDPVMRLYDRTTGR